MSVQKQVDEFELVFGYYTDHHLAFHVDYTFWEEFDEQSSESVFSAEDCIDESFEIIMNRYDYDNSISTILDNLRFTLQNAIWAMMNVPYPRDPYRYCDRVRDNLFTIFRDTVHYELYNAMIRENHHAQMIQRNWRRAISDPNYKACRNRLNREFEEDLPLLMARS